MIFLLVKTSKLCNSSLCLYQNRFSKVSIKPVLEALPCGACSRSTWGSQGGYWFSTGGFWRGAGGEPDHRGKPDRTTAHKCLSSLPLRALALPTALCVMVQWELSRISSCSCMCLAGADGTRKVQIWSSSSTPNLHSPEKVQQLPHWSMLFLFLWYRTYSALSSQQFVSAVTHIKVSRSAKAGPFGIKQFTEVPLCEIFEQLVLKDSYLKLASHSVRQAPKGRQWEQLISL